MNERFRITGEVVSCQGGDSLTEKSRPMTEVAKRAYAIVIETAEGPRFFHKIGPRPNRKILTAWSLAGAKLWVSPDHGCADMVEKLTAKHKKPIIIEIIGAL